MEIKFNRVIGLGLMFSCLFCAQSKHAQTAEMKISDSSRTSTIYADTSAQTLPADKFLYAGERRHTMDGQLPLLKTEIRPLKASLLSGIYLSSMIAIHINQQNAWWSSQRRGFHFKEDWVSALQVDKAGHAFGGYFLSYAMGEALMTSGVDYDNSALFGGILGIAYQSYIEIEDGFAGDWGFSPSDWYFDFLGSAFYLAQHYVPTLQNITPKWQYVPSEWTGKPIIGRPRTFSDDYNSSTFWYSINVYNILPADYKKYWVPWLNIAFGYGADAIDVKTDPNGPPDQLSERRHVIALDYNLVKILPEGGTFWNWARQTLNFMKFPSPAIEFSRKGTRFYFLYPFRINL